MSTTKIKLTIEQAKLAGFTVDTSCYPHIGYIGSRFYPEEKVNVYTQLEGELITKLAKLGVIHEEK